MDLQLDGRAFVVTGGSRGIGAAIVSILLEEGACVATCARSADGLSQFKVSLSAHAASRLLTDAVDVHDGPAMERFVTWANGHFGRLDGVVANAGSGIGGRLFDASPQDWIGQCSTKILSVMNLVTPAIQALKQSDAGRIVVINGITAKRPEPSMAVVSAARAAVANLAQTLALELASDRICVNAINIGVIDTDRQRERHANAHSRLPYQEWCKQEAVRRGIAFGRLGRPDEISPFVALLLSPLASYVTAACIDLHGGID